MKNILLITSSSIGGGAQKHIRDMFIALTNLGCSVYLAAPSGWLTHELSYYGENVYLIDAKLRNVRTLRKVMDKIMPDIVNTFILSGGCFGYFSWKKKKYGKIFITVNNPVFYNGISKIRGFIYPLLYKWMAKGASAFLVKSSAVGAAVKKTVGEKAVVLPIKNGINFSVFDKTAIYESLKEKLNISKDTILITSISMLEAGKGLNYFLDAANILRNNKNLHFIIVGDGSEKEKLMEYAKKLRLENVSFLGLRRDINAILSDTDIFVLSSLYEGLPNSLMEAMSMAKPCIATNVGGVRELISDESLGIVINPESADEIAENIDTLYKDKALRERLGQAAFDKMKSEYTLSAAADELIKIYER